MSLNAPMPTAGDTAIPDPYDLPLEDIDVSDAALYEANAHWRYFDRLRKEAPVHYQPNSPFGAFWSVTKFNDIVKVDSSHHVFSSEPTIAIGDQLEDMQLPMFIAMDPPKHDVQRKVVTPGVAPNRLARLEPLIRERVGKILDEIPRGETFNWVDHVSINLTTQMLATLFDFPFEERHRLTQWSEAFVSNPEQTGASVMTVDEFRAHLMDCLEYFKADWHRRAAKEPGDDFISLLAHHPATRNMIDNPMELLGNMGLLIVGGNDTTRNSLTGGLYALSQFPDEFAKLKADPSLIPNMVSEIIRWQTPLSHMRRLATEDTELGGQKIRKGDKVVMWYVSGNRDDEVIPDPYDFKIDRPKARHHVSFGFGIHRCLGNRLGEMQIRIAWEEILKRFDRIEVMGEPTRIHSNFVHGYTHLPARVPA
jgi:cytochrome P450